MRDKDIKILLSVDGGEILDHHLSASSLGRLSRFLKKKKAFAYETNSEANDKAVQLISRRNIQPVSDILCASAA